MNATKYYLFRKMLDALDEQEVEILGIDANEHSKYASIKAKDGENLIEIHISTEEPKEAQA